MTNEYYIGCDEENVWITLHPPHPCHDGYLNSFINIWIEDEEGGIESPLNSIEDAKVFAEILVKLLEQVT